MELAATVLSRLTTEYERAADPERAEAMAAYMRNLFPFLGLPRPAQDSLNRGILAGLDPPSEAGLRAVALGCWQLPEREYQYFACGYLRRHVRVCSAGFLDTARHLVVTKSWWDTVDALASRFVGPLVRQHPDLVSTMDSWSLDENLWLARTAILHQLTYKDRTDAERLFRYCTGQAGHHDFFIRKAIGWALREYAKTDPEAVRAYVHRTPDLSPLSVREALKNV